MPGKLYICFVIQWWNIPSSTMFRVAQEQEKHDYHGYNCSTYWHFRWTIIYGFIVISFIYVVAIRPCLRWKTAVTVVGETNSVIYKFTSIGMIRHTYCPIYIHNFSMIINQTTIELFDIRICPELYFRWRCNIKTLKPVINL